MKVMGKNVVLPSAAKKRKEKATVEMRPGRGENILSPLSHAHAPTPTHVHAHTFLKTWQICTKTKISKDNSR